MTALIHLNGPPGIGKSTMARRFVADHPGVLNCDIDVLRTLVGGWTTDFAMAGTLIRPAAMAMIESYLANGHDVVLPQLLVNPLELARFEACAARADARFVERFLMDDLEHALARFHRRGDVDSKDAWHAHVRDLVDAEGGEQVLRRYHEALQDLIEERPDAIVIDSSEGALDETYARLIASLA